MTDNAYIDDHEDNAEVPLYSDLYKYTNRTITFNQEKRRQLFLEKQKEKRENAFDEKRNLSQLFMNESLEPMECESTLIKHKLNKKFPFGCRLMGSEWLTEIPEDLTDNWLIKLCPEGVRYLVVANKAITTCYYRNGKPALRFKSKLPGGDSQCPHKFTVLDCVYNKRVNTLFIYDVLAWNSLSLLSAEAHMRFCWLKSKFQENPEMLEINPNKKFFFTLMDFFPGEKSLLQDQLFTPFVVNESEVPFDGVLLYHKEGHYTFGSTPLVAWLRTFMMQEIFNIDIHPSHLANRPQDYESVQQYLSSKKRKKKKLDLELVENEESELGNMEYDNL